ncbi:DNA polymerase III subunit alpha [Microbispora sp. NPDC049125]|uniref:DNA polymerase III subunit alpha n=1 Tax=Microbispora sp. NPDC049125 TaxID=3154929 RepID=UPI00346765A2
MMKSFTHLHVHTEYSMLDGAAKLDLLAGEAARQGMPAIAMSDHGNMHGAYAFHKKVTAAGVKPIIGIEAYVAPESRHHKKPVFWGNTGRASSDTSGEGGDVSGGGAFLHMTMLAENAAGLRNLFRLSSLASLEGFYRKPRMDRELISAYAEGVIATTGCPSGEVQTRLRLGQYDKALRAAADYQDIFGKGNFFLELMDHGLDIERRVRDGLLRISKALGLPPLATNDSHYVTEDQADAHDSLLCVGVGRTKDDPDRFRFNGSGYYLKSAAEMRDMWDQSVPGACDNTLVIAERVGSYDEVFAPRELMPRFPVPEGYTPNSWLRAEVARGVRERFGDTPSQEVMDRLDYELGVIENMGFSSYFLIVADICRYARDNGIAVGPGRGSATGSMVAYVTRITELDPIEHSLLFERFLNPDRVSMPDVDLDFDERRRADMIRYVAEKYGEASFAQIVTFSTIKAKAAVKDACRILGLPYALGEKISKAFPPATQGVEIPLSGISDPKHPRYGEAGELRSLYECDYSAKQVIDTARGLEGLTRGTGVHAAGVILSAEPLLDVLPVSRRESDGAVITQFDYPTCESIGLLKMDFLGLRNLTVIDDCLKMIEVNAGKRIDLLTLPLDDPATYALLARGETLGIFQLDGSGMRALLHMIRPDAFEDIAAALALYRPGPMAANSHVNYALRKNGKQPITPIHPELEEPLSEILGETYGLIVYQEQVMAIAQKVAGFSLSRADLLRRAMGKKKKAELDKQYEAFEQGMRDNGYSAEAVKTLWDILLPFSDYAFNKSHTAGYGLVSYWTAYLKANHPAEYMAALLTSVGGDKDKAAPYLNECRRMGIKVLPPDVNDSDRVFTPQGTNIRFGLSAVRNVGDAVVSGILSARAEKGPFVEFGDFLRKSPPVVCNKRAVESLIKAGAFDSFPHSRKGLFIVHEQAVEATAGVKKKEAAGMGSLFEAITGVPDQVVDVRIPAGEWDKATLLQFEREMLGLYVSDHPLSGMEDVLRAASDCTIAALYDESRPDGQTVKVGGILSSVQRKVTRKGDMMAVATLEDLEGSIEMVVFPAAYQLYGASLIGDAVVFVTGRLDRRDETVKLIAADVVSPKPVNDAPPPLAVGIAFDTCRPPLIRRLKEVLAAHPGPTEVHLHVHNGPRTTVMRLEDELRVDPSSALKGDLKQLLGPACLAV